MPKTYIFHFAPGQPQSSTGLFPTFILFNVGSTAVSPPGITETPSGSGIYQFSYGATIATAYLIDGAGSLSSVDRYIAGVLDPIQAIDQQFGFSSDSFGSTAVPGAFWGYLKRFLEHFEGDQSFTKATGLWKMLNRGSSTLLRTKNMTDTVTSAQRTGSGWLIRLTT